MKNDSIVVKTINGKKVWYTHDPDLLKTVRKHLLLKAFIKKHEQILTCQKERFIDNECLKQMKADLEILEKELHAKGYVLTLSAYDDNWVPAWVMKANETEADRKAAPYIQCDWMMWMYSGHDHLCMSNAQREWFEKNVPWTKNMEDILGYSVISHPEYSIPPDDDYSSFEAIRKEIWFQSRWDF